jgi:hypothetical protein
MQLPGVGLIVNQNAEQSKTIAIKLREVVMHFMLKKW